MFIEALYPWVKYLPPPNNVILNVQIACCRGMGKVSPLYNMLLLKQWTLVPFIEIYKNFILTYLKHTIQ